MRKGMAIVIAATVTQRIGRRGWLALACVTAVSSLAVVPAAASAPVSYSTGKFIINCRTDSTPQICDPPEKLKVKVKSGKVQIKHLRYVAATTHCSAGRVLVRLDGDKVGHTAYVNAGEEAIVDNLNVTLHSGEHKFAFRMQGKTGGCNVGSVGSWGGKITLKGTK